MANPTTAKPLAAELDAGHALAASALCFCPLLAGEALPRDIVGNVIGEPYEGLGYQQTGPLPAPTAAALVGGGLTEAGLDIKSGDAGFYFTGRGWSTTATPRTVVFVGRIVANADAGRSGTHVVQLCGSGTDGFTTGLGLLIDAAGTITLAAIRNGGTNYFSSGLTLTSGHYYALAVTFAASSGTGSRLFFAYDYDTQTATSAGAALTDATAYSPGTSGAAVLNGGLGYQYWNGQPTDNPFVGTCAAFGLFNASFDPAVNPTFWPGFYADPWGLARGAYTPSGALAAGSVAAASGAAAVTLAATRPAGGTAPYSIQWHRSTTSGFSPSGATAVAGLTSLTATDATAKAGTVYFYKAVWSDAAATPATVTSAQVPACLWNGERRVGVLGDSLWASNRAAKHFVQAMHARRWRVGVLNRGISGAQAYDAVTAGLSWQPSAIQPAAVNFDRALAAFVAGGCQDVILQLGSNDAGGSVSATTYRASVGNIVSALTAAGLRVLLVAPPLSLQYTEARQQLLKDYQAALAALDNGTTVRYVGGKLFDWVAGLKRTLGSDNLHYMTGNTADAVAGVLVAGMVADTVYSPAKAAGRVGPVLEV